MLLSSVEFANFGASLFTLFRGNNIFLVVKRKYAHTLLHRKQKWPTYSKTDPICQDQSYVYLRIVTNTLYPIRRHQSLSFRSEFVFNSQCRSHQDGLEFLICARVCVLDPIKVKSPTWDGMGSSNLKVWQPLREQLHWYSAWDKTYLVLWGPLLGFAFAIINLLFCKERKVTWGIVLVYWLEQIYCLHCVLKNAIIAA